MNLKKVAKQRVTVTGIAENPVFKKLYYAFFMNLRQFKMYN